MGGGKIFLFRDNFSCSLDPTCSEIVLCKFTELSHLVFAHLPSKEKGCQLKVNEKSRASEGNFAVLLPSDPSPRVVE